MLLMLYVITLILNIVLLSLDKISWKTKVQVIVVLAFYIVFNFSYIMYYYRLNNNDRHLYMLIVAIISILIPVFSIIRFIYLYKIQIVFKRHYLSYSLFVFLFIIGSLYMKNVYPLWDAACYLDSLNKITQTFDYGLHTRLNDYYLCGHISLGYTFFLLIGNFIFHSNSGPIIVQIIGGALSVCAFYATLRALHSEKEKSFDNRIILCTLGYMLSPAVFGLVGDLSVDYGMLILFPILVLIIVKELDYLQIIVGLMFCMTKEPAIIIYSGFILIPLIYNLKEKNIFRCVGMLIPCFGWLLAYLKLGAWGTGNSFSGNMNTFAVEKQFLERKILHLFVFNFNWLLSLLLILLLIVYCVKQIKCKVQIREKIFIYSMAIVMASVCFVIFSCLYITYTHYRYVMIITYSFFFLISNLYLRLAKNKIIFDIALIGLVILLCIQSFRTIDYLSSKIFTNINISEKDDSSIISLSSAMNDGIIYNREYVKYLSLIEKGLFAGNIDENTVVVIPNVGGGYYFSGHTPHGLYLDYDRKKFALSSMNYSDHLTELNYRIVLKENLFNIKDYDKLLIFSFPWASIDEGQTMNYDEFYDIDEGRWSAKVYIKYNNRQ